MRLHAFLEVYCIANCHFHPLRSIHSCRPPFSNRGSQTTLRPFTISARMPRISFPVQCHAVLCNHSNTEDAADNSNTRQETMRATGHRLTKVAGSAFASSLAAAGIAGSARAADLATLIAGPLFEPLREDSPGWLRTLVWNDFKLAVLFLVLIPLALWIWALVEQPSRNDPVKRIMFGYWQTSSLLMWTVYLQIGAQPVSFATAAAVQVLIPIVLWWWKDLNAEVKVDESVLTRVFRSWRIIATVLATSGAVMQLLGTQVTCTAQRDAAGILASPGCAAWLEPPLAYKNILHAGMTPEKLQVVGQVGAVLFLVFFLIYAVISLPRTGRLARTNESLSYKVLAKLGFYQS